MNSRNSQLTGRFEEGRRSSKIVDKIHNGCIYRRSLNTPRLLKSKPGGRSTLVRFTLFIWGYDLINYGTLFISNYSPHCTEWKVRSIVTWFCIVELVTDPCNWFFNAILPCCSKNGIVGGGETSPILTVTIKLLTRVRLLIDRSSLEFNSSDS